MGCCCGWNTCDPAHLPAELSVAPGATRCGGGALGRGVGWMRSWGWGPLGDRCPYGGGRHKSQADPWPAGRNWTITGGCVCRGLDPGLLASPPLQASVPGPAWFVAFRHISPSGEGAESKRPDVCRWAAKGLARGCAPTPRATTDHPSARGTLPAAGGGGVCGSLSNKGSSCGSPSTRRF